MLSTINYRSLPVFKRTFIFLTYSFLKILITISQFQWMPGNCEPLFHAPLYSAPEPPGNREPILSPDLPSYMQLMAPKQRFAFSKSLFWRSFVVSIYCAINGAINGAKQRQTAFCFQQNAVWRCLALFCCIHLLCH